MLLQKRSNGIYYFRWVYPPSIRRAVGKRELIKSLRTSSKSQALARAGAYYAVVDRMKEQSDLMQYGSLQSSITGFLDAEKDVRAGRITPFEFADATYSIVMPMFSEALEEIAQDHKPSNYSEMIKQRDSLAQLLEPFQEAATNQAGEIADGVVLAEQILSEIVSDKDGESVFSLIISPFIKTLKLINYGELRQALGRDLVAILHNCVEILNSKLNSQNAKPPLPSFSRAQVKPSRSDKVENPPNDMLFSKLFNEFLKHKIASGLSPKMQRDYEDYVDIFLFAVGDKPINTILKKDIKEFLMGYQRLPRRNLKQYKDQPIQKLWGREIPKEERIKPKTMFSAKKFLMGVFRYAVNQEFIAVTPMADLDLKLKVERARGPFSDAEVGEIFKVLDADPIILKRPWQKWAVLFGAYTGARAGEILSLLRNDIQVDSGSGLWIVTIRGTKTANALRQFPIPPELIAKGFITFVTSGDSEKLFQNASAKAITSFFPRILEKSGVAKLNVKGLTRSFHSFRHSVVTKARGANFKEALIQQVVGHERTGMGITDTYTHEFTLMDLLPVVSAIKYP